MYVVDGIGEPALKGANLPQERNTKGEFVTRIIGGANRAKRSDMNVECGEMVERESCASLVGMEEKATHSLMPQFCNQLKVCRQEAASEARCETWSLMIGLVR